jgi:hypothetical protein
VIDEGLISFMELKAKYQILLAENRLLKEELKVLKAGRVASESQLQNNLCLPCEPEPENTNQPPTAEPSSSTISNRSESIEKIRLFMSLFKGRDDVYAWRWENNKKGTSGYGNQTDSRKEGQHSHQR